MTIAAAGNQVSADFISLINSGLNTTEGHLNESQDPDQGGPESFTILYFW
jgi:hypothetical protein